MSPQISNLTAITPVFRKLWIVLLLLGAMIVLAPPTPAHADTVTKCGTIFSDETWISSNVYVISCGVTIPVGVNLTIQPGTVIKFGNAVTLRVDGTLVVQGTAENRVVFTSLLDDSYGGDTNGDSNATLPAPGDWGTIEIQESNATTFNFALVQYGGNDYYGNAGMLYLLNSSATVSNSIFRYSETDGVFTTIGAAPTITGNLFANNINGLNIKSGAPIVSGNTFQENSLLPLVQSPSASPIIFDNTFSGARNGIGITAGNVSGDITWVDVQGLGMPYVILGDVTIPDGSTLHLPAGTVVKLSNKDTNIVAYGILDVQGTAEDRVVFTSFRDDSYGGDTNRDGSNSAPAPGDWDAIILANSANIFEYSLVQYGGNTYYCSCGGLYVYQPATVTHNIFRFNESYGVLVLADGTVVNNNDIFDNYHNGLRYNGSATLNAENNWWGRASGPYNATSNPSGGGDTVSDNVDFTPWLTASANPLPPDARVIGITLDSAHYNSHFNRYIYRRGQDTAQITVNVTSNSGGYFLVWVGLRDLQGHRTSLTTGFVALAPFETEAAVFTWDIPPSATLLDYSIEVDINPEGDYGTSWEYNLPDALMVSDLTNTQLSALPSKCMSPDAVCANAALGVIPYAGIPANWVGLQDTWCNFIERGINGDPVGCLMAGYRTVNAAVELFHQTVGAITGVGNATSAAHSAIGAAADCLDAQTYQYVQQQCGAAGYTCLMARIFESFTLLYMRNTTGIAIAPGTTARQPGGGDALPARLSVSTGNGEYVEYDEMGQIVVNGAGMLYNIGPNAQMILLEGDGSGKEIVITSLSDTPIDVNLLQYTSGGAVAHVLCEDITMTPDTIATISLPDNQTSANLMLDSDGNGTPEQSIPPSQVTLGPATPTSLIAETTDTGIFLDWNPSGGATGYWVYYDDDGPGAPYLYGTEADQGASPIDVGFITQYWLTGLPYGTYYITVMAYNADGVGSGFSNEVTSTGSLTMRIFLPQITRR